VRVDRVLNGTKSTCNRAQRKYCDVYRKIVIKGDFFLKERSRSGRLISMTALPKNMVIFYFKLSPSCMLSSG